LIRAAIAFSALVLFELLAEAHEAVIHRQPHAAESRKPHATEFRKPHEAGSHPKPPKPAHHATGVHPQSQKVPKR
jgi:hypothetical protein